MTEKDIQREEEFDLVKGLLEAAEYRTSEDCISEEEIRRGGKLLIRVHKCKRPHPAHPRGLFQ